MKIIFLDVDGELTYSNYQNRETANIDIEKVKLVKEICDKTGAKVVISSSWRGSEDYTPKIYYVLIEILSKNGINFMTDNSCRNFVKGRGLYAREKRICTIW